MGYEQDTYDFIIVGAGPAGCALAASLSKTTARPRVLLLEAGGKNEDETLRVDGKRWTTFSEPSLNWGYKTTPQEGCNGRVLDYSRGKGIGGGSAINFGVYTVGARDDYDTWAEIVEDEGTFGWDAMQRRFKNLETFDGRVDLEENRKYAQPNPADHGNNGGLQTGYAKKWESDVPLILNSLWESGFAQNLDHNSGNPLGMGLMINSASKGRRTTAADLLVNIPDNLVTVTDTPVQRVLIQDKKAIGVETKGSKYFASKDVILSAGSLDTPKILMHSGIGPAAELNKFNIPVIQDLPAVGQGLKDHLFAPIMLMRSPESNDRNAFYGSEDAMDAALTQWNKDNTGSWTQYGCQVSCGWFKSDKVTSCQEFKDLEAPVQEFMNRETIPQYEVIAGFPVHLVFPGTFQDYSYVCLVAFLMNGQSSGEVRLQSSNPDDPLMFDPKFLVHPFDQRAVVEIYKHLLEATRHPSFAKDTVAPALAPESDSDEDILEFWRSNASTSWHMTGTAKMGKEGDADAAVDKRFRVIGVENLRVADMSVVPVLTNNHTQATAYVTGATCADVLIREYGLDRP
ncbi:oxidoreductase [Penicillium angulare]|uniref:oxidoreductase n=1 Tax=Penicillium angulare TaxID=116970 RepID=UPI00253FC96F|nr:oxidoreductase [Penicillium angulare]KAJ5281959.1 oxidoreductase [Penicillium angulare]